MTQIISKEIYELREMLRITGTKKSRFDEELTLGKVVEDKVKYIIDNEVLRPPFITCFTVFQILRGGTHWKHAEYKIKAGLLEHAGLGQPPNWYLAEQGKRFGYIMDWPPKQLRDVITGSIRQNIANPIFDSSNTESPPPYKIAWCKGYISEDNGAAKYIPSYGKFISSYFIMRDDKNLFPEIHNHILNQPMWYRKQFQMTLEKLPEMVIGMKKTADKIHSRASAFGKMWEIDENEKISRLAIELNPQVPDDIIDWRKIDEI